MALCIKDAMLTSIPGTIRSKSGTGDGRGAHPDLLLVPGGRVDYIQKLAQKQLVEVVELLEFFRRGRKRMEQNDRQQEYPCRFPHLQTPSVHGDNTRDDSNSKEKQESCR
jgi:hypothetical protein